MGAEIGFLITLGYHTARCYGYVSVSPTSSATFVELKLPGPVYYSVVQTIGIGKLSIFKYILKRKEVRSMPKSCLSLKISFPFFLILWVFYYVTREKEGLNLDLTGSEGLRVATCDSGWGER